MSYSTTSDASTIPALCEQRMELHFDELNQKLNDLIYKEQVNQLWKLDVESTLHSIWSKVCYQRVCVSTSSQTDELHSHSLLESAIRFDETSRTLLEEENELNHEGNLAKRICFRSDRQRETVHLNETSRTTQEHNNSFVSNVEEENEFNDAEQQDVVEVIPSSSSSIHEDKMTLSDASPEQPAQRTTKSRSKRVKLYPSKFSRKVGTSQHERTHVKSSFKCDNCLQVFRNHGGFMRHRRFCSYRPNESGSFECTECGKSYNTAGKLKDHLRHVHHTEKKHKCPVCGLALISPSQVKIHMVTHTGAKAFRCKFCSKRYTVAASLRFHIRMHHAKQQEST